MNLTPDSVSGVIAYASTTVVALGVLWRYVVRPIWRGWQSFKVKLHAALEVVDRELTHNGGSSLKDAVHRTDRNVAELDAQVTAVESRTHETADAVEALAQMLDNVVDRKQEDHERIWDAIRRLGGEDPRKAKP